MSHKTYCEKQGSMVEWKLTSSLHNNTLWCLHIQQRTYAYQDTTNQQQNSNMVYFMAFCLKTLYRLKYKRWPKNFQKKM